MSLLAFYPQIKTVHIALAGISGGLFFLRGLAVLTGAGWPKLLPVKLGSYVIDTFLLTSALMLYTSLPAGLFANGWLTVKVVMVVLYIVLGILSFRSAGHSYRGWLYYIAAVSMYTLIVVTALTHHPLGILSFTSA